MKSSRSLRLLLTFQTIPPLGVALSLFVSLGLFGWADFATGSDYPFSLFYILCVGAAALRFRPLASVGFATVVLVVWMGAALASAPMPTFGSLVWTLAIRYLTLLFLVFLATKLQAVFTELSLHALKDPLTGASNRRHFDDFFERTIRICRRYGRPLTLAYFDVDDFKAVNDRQGHHRGDEVLRTLASEILLRLRPEDLLARLGGDEFVLVLPDSGYAASTEILNRVFDAVEKGLRAKGLDATLSIGALTYTTVPEDPGELLRAADGLLYQVKVQGKGALLHAEAPGS